MAGAFERTVFERTVFDEFARSGAFEALAFNDEIYDVGDDVAVVVPVPPPKKNRRRDGVAGPHWSPDTFLTFPEREQEPAAEPAEATEPELLPAVARIAATLPSLTLCARGALPPWLAKAMVKAATGRLGAQVRVTSGHRAKVSAKLESATFAGKSRVYSHSMVKSALPGIPSLKMAIQHDVFSDEEMVMIMLMLKKLAA